MVTYRFIAGAICPKCQAEDRIMAYKGNKKCVACGFQDSLLNDEVAPTALLEKLGTPVQTLRLVEPDKNDDTKDGTK